MRSTFKPDEEKSGRAKNKFILPPELQQRYRTRKIARAFSVRIVTLFLLYITFISYTHINMYVYSLCRVGMCV